jgi:RNA polymerase sigma-70 factor (ECF subfamily)
VTAARRALIDGARRRSVAARALPELERLADVPDAGHPAVPDKRLELLFACAHPAIDPAMHSPLMLQAVLGLDAVRIGRAFLVPGPTVGQRLVRAKAKIKQAGVPFRLPDAEQLPARLEAVLDAVFAAYGTGYDDREERLTAEAVRLATLVTELVPAEPETHGLLALLLHVDARSAARRDAEGRFVPLDQQDPRRWDAELMARAERHLARALALGHAGPFQLQAAIQSMHNRRALTGTTDREAIAALYDGLVRLTPTTGARVARAQAHAEAYGAQAALALLHDVAEDPAVAGYQPYWVARARCLAAVGDLDGEREAAARAVELTGDPAVRAHLTARHRLPDAPASLPR